MWTTGRPLMRLCSAASGCRIAGSRERGSRAMVKVPGFLRPRQAIDQAEVELAQARTAGRLASMFGLSLESPGGLPQMEVPFEAERPRDAERPVNAEQPVEAGPRGGEKPGVAQQAREVEQPFAPGPPVRSRVRAPTPAVGSELPANLVGVMAKPDKRGGHHLEPHRESQPRVMAARGPVSTDGQADDWRSRADAYILAVAFGTAPAAVRVRPADAPDAPAREEAGLAVVAQAPEPFQPIPPTIGAGPVDLRRVRPMGAERVAPNGPVSGADPPTRSKAVLRRTEPGPLQERPLREARPLPVRGRRARASTTAPAPAPPSVSCPYCARLLEPPPASSRTCPRCRQRIVVKHVDGRAVYLTADAVPIFESERRRVASSGRWTRERQRWLKLAAAAGATSQRAEWLAAAPPSDEVVESARALYMTTVERLFRSAKADRRWEEASRLRREQAMTLFRLAGSPSTPPQALVELKRDAEVAELRSIAQIVREARLVSADCCDICRADDGLIFRIAQELQAPRLPHQRCPTGLCRCRWALPPRDQTAIRRSRPSVSASARPS